MRRRTRNEVQIMKVTVVAFLFCTLSAITVAAQTFTSLAEFDNTNGGGAMSLIRGVDGNFYGVTVGGGSGNGGTIFKITPVGVLSTVYNFCSQYHCADGQGPQSLVLGRDGNFYGTAAQGGHSSCNGGTGCGVIFKLTNRGVFTVLYAFSLDAGARPSGLIQGLNGNFYGSANSGGANDRGSVFELTPTGQLTVLYSFCPQPGCADGSFPGGTLIQIADGTLYGAASSGGTKGSGTIYKIAPDGAFSTLHNFVGRDGSVPVAIIQGADANFYGITLLGGSNRSGTIFRLTAAGQLTTLYSFCAQSNCADGEEPETLMQASDGNLYGGTGTGGTLSCGGYNLGCGTLFELSAAGKFTTLHAFDLTDGYDANSLLQDTSGSFFGTTVEGGDTTNIVCGSSGCGTVFELATGLAPFVELRQQSGRVGQTGGILGRGLAGTTAVFFNGTPASFKVVSDTFLRATVPVGATSGFITVQTPSGTLSSNVRFQVVP